jgi:hypothetical protein
LSDADRIAELERRLDELERRRPMVFCGYYEDGAEYRPGEVVQYRNATWHCWCTTTDTPGTSDAWQMIQKSMRPRRGAG